MNQDTANKVIIITAPSGAGKTSITRHLLKTFPGKVAFSVSAATRAARGEERDGVDYYFIDMDMFNDHIAKDDFVEWEMVYEGKYYGTLKSELQRIWSADKTPVLDIDVKGAIHVKQQFTQTSLTIFIEPPSVDELHRRLSKRGTESDEAIQTRMGKSAYELSFRHHFDHVIVNENFEKACLEAENIVRDFLK